MATDQDTTGFVKELILCIVFIVSSIGISLVTLILLGWPV